MAERMDGKVKWFKDDKGYGFVLGSDGLDYFVHYSTIQMEGRKTLTPDQRVTFVPGTGERGRRAADVALVG